MTPMRSVYPCRYLHVWSTIALQFRDALHLARSPKQLIDCPFKNKIKCSICSYQLNHFDLVRTIHQRTFSEKRSGPRVFNSVLPWHFSIR